MFARLGGLLKSNLSGARRAEPRKPDMTAASIAFAEIVQAREEGLEATLGLLVRANAEAVLAGGGSMDEALSAQWGGGYGVDAELAIFRTGLEAYDATMAEAGAEQPHPGARYRMAATYYLALVLAEVPDDYERYLSSLGT